MNLDSNPTAAEEDAFSAARACGEGASDVDLNRLRLQVSVGDHAAFNDLCRALLPRLWKQGVLLCGNAAQAEDLVQETLVEAWRALPRFEGRCQIFTWMCAILLNRYRNLARRQHAWLFTSLEEIDQVAQERLRQMPDRAIDPAQAAEEGERNVRLQQALRFLPHRQREVIHLRFYVGDSLDGIAAALGCSVGTVKSRLFHGLERLRKMKVMQRNSQ